MCGFAGLISSNLKNVSELKRIALQMAGTLEHRGPDDSGVWMDKEVNFAMGHKRLSIVDLSIAGHQPMVSPSGRFVITFNGEIYNHYELRKAIDTQFSLSMSNGVNQFSTASLPTPMAHQNIFCRASGADLNPSRTRAYIFSYNLGTLKTTVGFTSWRLSGTVSIDSA